MNISYHNYKKCPDIQGRTSPDREKGKVRKALWKMERGRANDLICRECKKKEESQQGQVKGRPWCQTQGLGISQTGAGSPGGLSKLRKEWKIMLSGSLSLNVPGYLTRTAKLLKP